MIYDHPLPLNSLPLLEGHPVIVSEYVPWGHMLLQADSYLYAQSQWKIVVGSGPCGSNLAGHAERVRRLAIVDARRIVRRGMGVTDYARDLRDLLLEKAAAA